MSSKFHLSKWKTYFSQFIDKFFKIESVEDLIHYVKRNMWPALFYINYLCFGSAYIVLGRDDWLRKVSLKVLMEW